MNEPIQRDQPVPAAGPVSGSASAGSMLRAAREAQGLQVCILAAMLKVPVPKLEALEADRFDDLMDVVFARGLAASMCRVLKIDSTAVMAALPKSEIRRVKTSLAGLNTPIKTGRFALGEPLASRLISPLSIGAFSLVLGILAIVFWPEINRLDAVSRSEVALSESPSGQVTTAVTPLISAATSLPADTSALSQAAQVQVTPVQETSTRPDAETAPALMLQARDTCWVEITDANGVVQLRRLLEAGEVLQLDGALPLSVVLGRADKVDVTVRGQPLDAVSMSKAHVARFEVK